MVSNVVELYALTLKSLRPGDVILVKPGTYKVTSGGGWTAPAINLASSGTAGAPITIRSEKLHGAILDAAGGKRPLLGANDRSHIVIDGFDLRNSVGSLVAIFNSSNITLQNNLIHHAVPDSNPAEAFGNTEGIRVEDSQNVTIRNNKIYDIYNKDRTHNASGIKTYYTRNTLVENNEIFDTVAGAYDKRGGINNVWRKNYFHDCTEESLAFMGVDHSEPGRGPDPSGNRFEGNAYVRCAKLQISSGWGTAANTSTNVPSAGSGIGVVTPAALVPVSRIAAN